MVQSKVVLVVAAHSDDEALGCSGTMIKHVEAGDVVHLLFMTDGVGAREVRSKELLEERQSASEKVAKILGVSSIQNLNFPDNQMDLVPLLEVTQALENVISEMQPEIIYTHHLGDLNVDHQVCHKAVMTACRPQPNSFVKKIYAFEVLSSTEWQTPGVTPFFPNVFIDIGRHIELKRKVLEVYSEEMREPPHSRSIENSIRQSRVRGSTVGLNYVEAFVLIREIK